MRYQVPPFLVAVMAPEWILAWAMQQWIVANQIAKRGGEGWTRNHGFFILMGGFHAFTRKETEDPIRNPGDPCYPLDQKSVVTLVEHGHIELPLEEEIQDRSKTDWLAKILVMLQISWFMAQCIARGASRLPLSELEVLTLAYTIMNAGTYIAWWDKPRSVERPIRVFMSSKAVQQERKKALQRKGSMHAWESALSRALSSILPGSDRRFLEETFLVSQKGVPMFYSGIPERRQDFLLSAFISSAVGSIFGAIHCIAWSYVFPSYTEQLLWRLSSMAMIGVPASVFAAYGAIILEHMLREHVRGSWLRGICIGLLGYAGNLFLCVTFFLGPLIYGLARIMTFVLAFKTLASLPAGAFYTIPWTKWVPHV